MKKIIILNGASSSGKSTIARKLQSFLKTRNGGNYGVISIDDFLVMTADEPIYEDDVYDIMPEMCNAIRKELAVSNGIIIDHVITSERIYTMLLDEMEGYEVYLIRITCSQKVLAKRERERKNRCAGSAAASESYLFPTEGYHLIVDTTEASGEECAKYIAEQLR